MPLWRKAEYLERDNPAGGFCRVSEICSEFPATSQRMTREVGGGEKTLRMHNAKAREVDH